MSIAVRVTMDVTTSREVTVPVDVDGPDDVGMSEVVEAVERVYPFGTFAVTDYEVLDGTDA